MSDEEQDQAKRFEELIATVARRLSMEEVELEWVGPESPRSCERCWTWDQEDMKCSPWDCPHQPLKSAIQYDVEHEGACPDEFTCVRFSEKQGDVDLTFRKVPLRG